MEARNWKSFKNQIRTKERFIMSIKVGINGFGRIGRLVFRDTVYALTPANKGQGI